VHGRQFHEGKAFVNVVKSVAHTGITVRDLEASIAFWRDVLGFEVQRRMEMSGEFAEQVTGVPGAHFDLAALATTSSCCSIRARPNVPTCAPDHATSDRFTSR
jgi:catechol 2,3-dioxygenase-like lactoylglutathione lyase family enzyme